MLHVQFVNHDPTKNDLEEYKPTEIVYFLQYTGNEEALDALASLVEKADYSEFYEAHRPASMAVFTMDSTVRFTEDEITKLRRMPIGTMDGRGNLFTVVGGRCEYEFSQAAEERAEELLHDLLWENGRIYFTPTDP